MQDGVTMYDSVKGFTNHSVVYMIYQNCKAYPRYLVTYSKWKLTTPDLSQEAIIKMPYNDIGLNLKKLYNLPNINEK